MPAPSGGATILSGRDGRDERGAVVSQVAVPARPRFPLRGHVHVKRILLIGLIVVTIGAAATLLGWDIRGWFDQLWETLTEISPASIVASCILKTAQTSLTAFAWFSILVYAFPAQRVVWRQILACYAASVAINGLVPANLGTLTMLIMFVAIIPTATFAAILGGYAVEKIFYTVIGIFVYLYLFLSVGGSFDIQFAWVHEHPWATVILVTGIVALCVVLVRRFWPRVVKWWEQAKSGGRILAEGRPYWLRVFLPSLGSWIAMLGVMAIFLHAYGIPVTFHTLMSLCGGNSIANVTSVTPGGAGITQAFNVASLSSVTDATTATAYSVAQQIFTTAWNIVFAIAMLCWAFGWSGGKDLVGGSYEEAKRRAAEQKAAHDARKAEKRAAKGAEA
jgi:uncharacterized membrane protein YbhN (UPF0104 family)